MIIYIYIYILHIGLCPNDIILNKHNVNNQAVKYHFSFIFKCDQYINKNYLTGIMKIINSIIFFEKKIVNLVFVLLLYTYSCGPKPEEAKNTHIKKAIESILKKEFNPEIIKLGLDQADKTQTREIKDLIRKFISETNANEAAKKITPLKNEPKLRDLFFGKDGLFDKLSLVAIPAGSRFDAGTQTPVTTCSIMEAIIRTLIPKKENRMVTSPMPSTREEDIQIISEDLADITSTLMEMSKKTCNNYEHYNDRDFLSKLQALIQTYSEIINNNKKEYDEKYILAIKTLVHFLDIDTTNRKESLKKDLLKIRNILSSEQLKQLEKYEIKKGCKCEDLLISLTKICDPLTRKNKEFIEERLYASVSS